MSPARAAGPGPRTAHADHRRRPRPPVRRHPEARPLVDHVAVGDDQPLAGVQHPARPGAGAAPSRSVSTSTVDGASASTTLARCRRRRRASRSPAAPEREHGGDRDAPAAIAVRCARRVPASTIRWTIECVATCGISATCGRAPGVVGRPRGAYLGRRRGRRDVDHDVPDPQLLAALEQPSRSPARRRGRCRSPSRGRAAGRPVASRRQLQVAPRGTHVADDQVTATLAAEHERAVLRPAAHATAPASGPVRTISHTADHYLTRPRRPTPASSAA